MTERGTITIATALRHVNADGAARPLEPGDYVVLTVQDDGAGMPAHVKARAAEPFFTTKGPGEGTGLGLAMAQGFVQQSGGRLEIESEPGQGATIRMYFPVLSEARSRPLEPSPGYTPHAVEGATRKHILVVDDSSEILALAEETLRENGYEVTTATSGEEALKRVIDGEDFDLLFSDVVMPGGMNGLVLADEVRRRRPELPVLLTTGYNDELALEGPRPEAMDVIGKPYRRTELIDRVQASLRRSPQSGPARKRSDFGAAEA